MKILTDTGLLAFWNKIKQLVLGNRPYEPTEFSGKGYKVLEKNIQTVDGVKKNILTAVMLNLSNTIYEIRYDFDLGGETIEMKEGCILKFNGGSLNNGTLKGNITEIKASANQIFNLQLTLDGSFNNEFILSEWYGAIGNSNIDCSFALNKALNSPIKCLKLLEKQYLVENTTVVSYLVDGKNYNANIIVPNNKIIIGSGTSDYTNNSTIVVSENTISDIALFISDRQVQISNITILGKERIDGKYSCNKLVVTQKSVANLNFRNVAVKYCNNVAFDMDAYLSTFYSCSAAKCKGSGFYFHSSTGHNTSVVLTKCYASGIEEEGYIFHNMDYCSLISCAADECGCAGTKDKATYRFIQTRGISFISCGCENTCKIMECLSGVEGLNIIGCFFLLKEENSYTTNYDFSKVWNLDYVTSMNVSNSIIGRLFSTEKLITATEHTKAKFENCVLFKKDSSDEVKIKEEIINYSFTNQEKVIKNISIYSTINKIEGNFSLDSIIDYNNTFVSGYIKFNIGISYFDSKKLIDNIQGNVAICGNTTNTYCYITDIFKINNCNKVSLNNLKIDFSSLASTADTGFYIENSNVVFNNVIFHNTIDKILFKLVNSTVCFNNCTFNKKYGASYLFEQTLKTDNSSKIIFNNKNLGTSTDRGNYIPLSKGSTWFDNDLNKLVLWNGTAWINIDGSALS